ncbi:MAG: ClbS/DfsB family four-helix bundle protein [Gammaproteobacteria bacterium]|nr:ClbS/DfsB family four-helix bundle protein [Gammaproteobacteria bacterium]
MPLPASKHEVLQNLELAYIKLDAEFDAVLPKFERTPDIEGSISCCDVLAYQIGWGKLLMSWEQLEKSGEVPEMPAEGFKWNQLGLLADSFYKEYSAFTLNQLREEFAALQGQLSDWVYSLTETELQEPHQRRWTGEKWAIVKWFQVNTIAPYKSARTKVRRWKREQKI